MRILNQDKMRQSKNFINVNISEATELRDELERLLSQSIKNDHGHINDEDYKGELTVALYDCQQINEFNQRVKTLILENK